MSVILFFVEYQQEYRPNGHSKSRRNNSFLKIALSWAIAIAIAVGLQQFVFQSYQVFGRSMEPTLSEGDYLIISKVGPSWSSLRGTHYEPDRGDIVVLEANNTRLIKRIIGLSGDTIRVENGKLTVTNDEDPVGFDPYEGASLSGVRTSGDIRVQVPEGEVFVVGDNREGGNSLDSRNQLGTIPVEDIVGSLWVRLWPAQSAEVF